MSEQPADPWTERAFEERPGGLAAELDGPILGVAVREQDYDAIARIIARARQNGFSVFVTHYGDEDIPPVKLARSLGAHVIHPVTDEPGEASLRATFSKIGRVASQAGLVWHSNPQQRVDYAESKQLLEASDDGFAEAVPEDDDRDGEQRVVAALPAYNEGRAIANVVKKARVVVDEVVVVDDGSTDDTARLAAEAGATVVEHERNRGYGAALQTAFREARDRRADVLVTLDADGQHDPGDIPGLVAALNAESAQIVIGNRFAGGTRMPRYRRTGLAVVNLLTNLGLGNFRPSATIGDTQSGFRAYSSAAIQSLAAEETIGDRMSASTDILFHCDRQNYEIAEVGTTIDYDVPEASTRNPIAHGVSLVRNLVRKAERERPIASLWIPGLLSACLGVVLSYYAVDSSADALPSTKREIVAGALLTLVGVALVVSGAVLHAFHVYASD